MVYTFGCRRFFDDFPFVLQEPGDQFLIIFVGYFIENGDQCFFCILLRQ